MFLSSAKKIGSLLVNAAVIFIVIGSLGFTLVTTVALVYNMASRSNADSSAPHTTVAPLNVENAEQADATVVSIRETHSYFNYHPEVELKLLVRPKNKPAFEASARFYLSFVHIPDVQPGKILKVFYDPEHLDTVTLVDKQIEF
jgi:hypothetical protein